MSDQLNRIEEMVETLIRMVGDVKADVQDFRIETSVHSKKLDRRIRLIESDLDTTMVKVEELTPPKN